MRHGCRKGAGWWCGRVKGQGYKLTISRQAILEVLSKTSKHLSAEEIYNDVYKIYPGAGLATVYRTLELLVELGLVHKFDFGDGRARYELIEGPEGKKHHHHLICTKCGKIIDYTDFIEDEVELLKKIEKGLSEKYNFNINDHLIQFTGLCEKCRR
ncbi:MAG: Fur family transcriptional regulator [Candidatus Omnitrophica bacterium]|nr:Fur family transcriptional regulator [Candidatus Omnitrophota bacterium]MDD5440635.1 Fur family transcriptional regulator [Candidatus Omnitrophota bacterium]